MTRFAIIILITIAPIFAQVNAVCWPNESDIKGASMYVCDLRAIPGTPLTGTHLMSMLADIEPIPAAFVIKKGEDANRGGWRRRLERIEKYALPIIAGLAAGNVFQVSTAWRVALATLPSTVPNIREWVGAAVEPDWEIPAQLIPTQDISFDSHGSAQIVLYARRENGVVRVTIPPEPVPAPAAQPIPTTLRDSPSASPGMPQERHLRSGVTGAAQAEIPERQGGESTACQFQLASWLTLYRESQARSREVIEHWRATDESWKAFELAEGGCVLDGPNTYRCPVLDIPDAQGSRVFMNQAEAEALALIAEVR